MTLLPGERIDRLGKIQIIQSSEVFAFSLDAVVLAHFAQLKPRSRVVDLAAGNGAVGLFVAPHTTGQVTLVELQPRLADMARRSVTLNGFTNVDVLTHDLNTVDQVLPKDSVDVVTCNPPYFPVTPQAIQNPNRHLALARHELTTDFAQVASTTASLLKYQGKAYFVHRPDRLPELLHTLVAADLAPKHLQFVQPRGDREANMVLIEAIRAGKPGGVRILPPIVVYGADGAYTPEVEAMLHG